MDVFSIFCLKGRGRAALTAARGPVYNNMMETEGCTLKKTCILWALMLCLLLPGAFAETDAERTVVLATDMHYLSPTLTDYGQWFMNTVYAADGKVIHYSAEICRAFVRDMLLLQPDTVILSGDLTLNGAPASHKEFSALLGTLTEAGIQVLVIPGNHDVGGRAYRFEADGAHPIPAATKQEFYDFYAPFGYTQALSRDEASLSYVAKLSDQMWAVMLDVNANGLEGSVKSATYTWLEEQLKQAKAQGVSVIGVSHQNLLPHNKYFTAGVMINQPKKLQQMYASYGVGLNLSGHTHMQHIASNDSTVEIVTSALALAPSQYGVMTLRGKDLIAYDARPVDVEGWAAENGETRADLLHFSQYTQDFFCEVVRRKMTALLDTLNAPDADRQRMLDFGVELSLLDFTGTRGELGDTSALALWEKYMTNNGYTYYLRGALEDGGGNMTHYDFR